MAQCVVYLWFLTYSLPESTATLHSLMIFSKRCSKCSMSLSSLETNCLRGEKHKKKKQIENVSTISSRCKQKMGISL